jgi:uncharacterized protein (TIGR02452 family)
MEEQHAPLPAWNTAAYRMLGVRMWNSQLNLALVARNNREWVAGGHVHVPLTASYTIASLLKTTQTVPIWTAPAARLARVTLVDETTDVGVRRLKREQPERRVATLNFANARGAGGGYQFGCLAQEEHLCRAMPALFASLEAARYEFDFWNELKYTPGIEIARDSTDFWQPLPRAEWTTCSVITAAAPDLRPDSGDVWDASKMARLLHGIFRAPLVCEPSGRPACTIQVGAFGNGAFANDPAQTSQLMCDAIEAYRPFYRDICVSIPDAAGINHRTYAAAMHARGLVSGAA